MEGVSGPFTLFARFAGILRVEPKEGLSNRDQPILDFTSSA